MSKVRVFTPVVAVNDNMRDAHALNVSRLEPSKVRIGLLDNTKPNAGLLLGHVQKLLTERRLAASAFVLDKSDSPCSNPASHGATEAVFKQFSEKADVVITGLAI